MHNPLKMNRLFKLMMTGVVLLLVLAACGQSGQDSDPGTGANPDPNTGLDENENLIDDEQIDGELTDDEGVKEDELAPRDQEEGEELTVTLYFADADLVENYRVQKVITVAEGENPAQAALQAWVKGPDEEGLTGLVPKEVVVEYVEEKDGLVEVSFSKDILNANVGSAGELLIMEQIAMIMEQFGYKETQILVEGEVVETLFGHMSADQPIQAGNPEDFKEWTGEGQ